MNIGPVWSRISNWVGAEVAAKRLSELDIWKRAKVVKCNPDPPQIPVRLRALYDGKLLYMPVPEFGTGELPWVLLDLSLIHIYVYKRQMRLSAIGPVRRGI